MDCCLSSLLLEPKAQCRIQGREQVISMIWLCFKLFAIFYSEILVDFQISMVFLQFHSCILWNPWISVKSSIFVLFCFKFLVLYIKCFELFSLLNLSGVLTVMSTSEEKRGGLCFISETINRLLITFIYIVHSIRNSVLWSEFLDIA